MFPLLARGFLLINLFPVGIIGVGAMLIRFARLAIFHLVRVFVLFLGLSSLFRELKMWGVILALQSSGAVHLGVDNLSVVRHVGRLLEGMVLDGRVREIDKLGNDAADEAADFGRRRVGNLVIDARRNLSGVCDRWYPLILDLHRFFIAIARAVVNHDDRDGVALDPLVWSAGACLKRRRLVHAVRDRAMLPGPPAIWDSEWINVLASAISADDVVHWPYTPGLFVKWVAFLGTLHWPAGGADLGVGGISHVELLILYELWAGERLSLEKAQPRYLRLGRPISVSAVLFGPGIDIWRSCRFIGALMRSLCLLPGGLARFVPCLIGVNHCRLRHIGWEKCGHGLTLTLFKMNFWSSFSILLGLGVLCLLVLFACPSVLCCSLCLQDSHLAVTCIWSCS